MKKAKRLIKKLGVDKVREIVDKAHHDAHYYVDAWTENFGGVHGFYTDKCIVGVHNQHTHYKLSELKGALANVN
ncbi:hypothetical protein [Acinetobacter rudis]|uniref:hypothetical protein n=1 Tax=Acinetobacter rudis TaxID=632955 RepID=UPI00333EEB28